MLNSKVSATIKSIQKYDVLAVNSIRVRVCAVALAGGSKEHSKITDKCHKANEVFAKRERIASANNVRVLMVCNTDGNSSLNPNITSIA